MVDGRRMRKARGERSVRSVERDTGVDRGLISRLEDGERTSMRTETLVKLARYYSVSTDYLLGGEMTGVDWVDVRERLPARGELVLVTYKSSSNKRSVELARWTGSFWVFPDSRLMKRSDRVTGWMPQPYPYIRETEGRRRPEAK